MTRLKTRLKYQRMEEGRLAGNQIDIFDDYQNMSLVVRKPAFCICENKDADQLCAFVFAIRIVSLYYLNPKL